MTDTARDEAVAREIVGRYLAIKPDEGFLVGHIARALADSRRQAEAELAEAVGYLAQGEFRVDVLMKVGAFVEKHSGART